MPRILFEKRGEAVWISHLDLMRLFQRAFKRAGLSLTHTQGFNPRPSVSIALPLSVGVESGCELLDFALDGENVPGAEICKRLNGVLVPGIKVLDFYDGGRKIRDIAFMRSRIYLTYDNGLPDCACTQIEKLLARKELIVPKKTKSGIQDQDLIPMIRSATVEKTDDWNLCIELLHCCQNPTLNPMQIPLAVEMYLPDHKPDFSRCARMEIYDSSENVFR